MCIINTQQPGEHPFCGDGLSEKSGFTYDPEEFTDHGISFYNFSWPDMGIPEQEQMLFIMHVMDNHIKINKQKVAVHCHAGQGRTGIVIACYFVYNNKMSPQDSIQLVRDRRPGSIQSNKQTVRFYLVCSKLKVVFPEQPINVQNFLKRQDLMLYGEEKIELKDTPKILSMIVKRFEELLVNKQITKEQMIANFISFTQKNEDQIKVSKRAANSGDWQYIKQLNQPEILAQILLDWLEISIDSPLIPSDILTEPYQIKSLELLKILVKIAEDDIWLKSRIITALAQTRQTIHVQHFQERNMKTLPAIDEALLLLISSNNNEVNKAVN